MKNHCFCTKKIKSAFSLEQSGTKRNGTLISMLRYTCVTKVGSFGCRDQCTWALVSRHTNGCPGEFQIQQHAQVSTKGPLEPNQAGGGH